MPLTATMSPDRSAAIAAASASRRTREFDAVCGSRNSSCGPQSRAGDRLGMKAPVGGIGVFAAQSRAQSESRPSTYCSDRREDADQRVARPALRAIDEGIAEAAIVRVGEFGEAVVARNWSGGTWTWSARASALRTNVETFGPPRARQRVLQRFPAARAAAPRRAAPGRSDRIARPRLEPISRPSPARLRTQP